MDVTMHSRSYSDSSRQSSTKYLTGGCEVDFPPLLAPAVHGHAQSQSVRIDIKLVDPLLLLLFGRRAMQQQCQNQHQHQYRDHEAQPNKPFALLA